MHVSSPTELRRLSPQDLQREVNQQRTLVAQLRWAVDMNKEKDQSKLQKAKRQLARMLTVLNERMPQPVA